ncbi:MAG: 2-C-methyl-D-erythritol 2,4-cyclodiphosphate synthase [Oscillospiraceae bacterium]|nr:2-C-methyl-D-erythritol 2,4-cyclodiphosphate synthase [Oscillospiraceae bacterium]
MMVRIGHGYDVHRFAKERKCVIGGVEIPFEMGLLGHSDADVLLHAIADALLGAAALGDIGKHFPDNDPAYAGANSLLLLEEVVRLLKKEGYRVGNIDSTIIAQRPKLAPYLPAMQEKISRACAVDGGQVSVKATTEEGLGFTGAMEGVAAHAVCLLEKL